MSYVDGDAASPVPHGFNRMGRERFGNSGKKNSGGLVLTFHQFLCVFAEDLLKLLGILIDVTLGVYHRIAHAGGEIAPLTGAICLRAEGGGGIGSIRIVWGLGGAARILGSIGLILLLLLPLTRAA